MAAVHPPDLTLRPFIPCVLFIPFCASQYDGYPDECIVEGVCKYVDIGQGPVSFEPTTGGKGKSEWRAHVDACFVRRT